MVKKREYIQARNLLAEAKAKIKSYDAVLGTVRKKYETLRKTGIPCKAFSVSGIAEKKITVTRQCWNHLFKHPTKRKTRIAKLERALCFDMAIKLLKKTTTYQEVSREKDKGGNEYLFFGIIGYVRGNRIKVLIRKQEKYTNAKYVLFSFYQMSKAPITQKQENKKA